MQTNTLQPARPLISLPAIPSWRTLANLFAGGYVGLMAWEIWSRTITVWVVGGPLEPPGLVLSLFNRFAGTGFEHSNAFAWANATAMHYVLGIVGYPVLYYLISRTVKAWDVLLDVGVWLAFSGYVAWSLSAGTFTPWFGWFWLLVTMVTATRFLNPSKLVQQSLSFGSFTWFNALGIFAPIAGLPFLLMEWGGVLSFMSWVGHILFGFLLAYIFEQREAGETA